MNNQQFYGVDNTRNNFASMNNINNMGHMNMGHISQMNSSCINTNHFNNNNLNNMQNVQSIKNKNPKQIPLNLNPGKDSKNKK